jgi:RNA polymerase sigma-70 factor (ECF subfamily)
MLKITNDDPMHDPSRFRLEGRLVGPWVEELARVAGAALQAHPGITLDLAAVAFVDAAGAALLCDLRGRATELVQASPLVLAQMEGAVPMSTVIPFAEARARVRAAPAITRPPADDEAALLAGLRAGDAGSFEAMVRAHAGRMLAVARRFVRNEDDARDVVQEALLAAYRKIGGFAGTARLSTWLHRIVVNAALMRLRTARRRPEDSIDELLPRFEADGHFAGDEAGIDTAVLVERAETRSVVRACIAELPESYRTILLLRDIEERDTDETAALLGLSTNAAKTRLHRARQALRTLLAARLGAATDPRRRAHAGA